mgnify:CR=1 FL=1
MRAELFLRIMEALLPSSMRAEREARMQRSNAAINDIVDRKCAHLRAAWDAYDTGVDWRGENEAMHEAAREELRHQQQQCQDVQGARIVAWSPRDETCPACRALDGQVVAIETELAAPRLPAAGCTCAPNPGGDSGFCLCSYEPVFDDEM